jgi:hypothetical protein
VTKLRNFGDGNGGEVRRETGKEQVMQVHRDLRFERVASDLRGRSRDIQGGRHSRRVTWTASRVVTRSLNAVEA